MERPSRKEIYDKGKIGVMSGFISGIIILVAFVGIDSLLMLGPWSFYTMIGLALGLHGLYATVFGIFAHILTALTIGATFCICSSLHPILRIDSTWKGMLAGGITGLEVYAIFFMPITLFIVLPAIDSNGINFLHATAEEQGIISALETKIPTIMEGAIIFHILYGSLMGIYSSIFLTEYKTRKKINV